MNTAATLMLELLARGVRLRITGHRLQFSPRSAVTGDLLERLRTHKGDLLAILKAAGGDTYQVEERAAIHEFDAGIPRSLAERLAMLADDDFQHGYSGYGYETAQNPRTAGVSLSAVPDPKANAAPVIESQELPEASTPDFEVIDFPDPCSACGGIVWWQSLAGNWYCERCTPRTTGPRLRELARRLRVRYGLSGDAAHGQVVEQRRGMVLPSWPPVIPDSILADPIPACSGCGRPVIGGQPGRPLGLCFRCWMKGR